VFFDPTQRTAPQTQAEYLAAEHITVLYEPRRSLDLDQWLLDHDVKRTFRVMVPGFAGLPAFIRGSQLIATVPGLLQKNLLRDLANAPVPVPCPTMPMYMIWHRRYQDDSSHRWLRGLLIDIASQVSNFSPQADGG
jgi:DNA-binding transcriptional LysR family regulator